MDMTIGKADCRWRVAWLGATETARLFGIDKPGMAKCYWRAKMSFHSPRQAIREGVAFTPENGRSRVPHLSVLENIILAASRQGSLRAFGKTSVEIAEDYG
jgi:ABC-type uncharacterized transport system ATPase subunit